MRLLGLGPLPLSIIGSLLIAVLLLAMRVFVMQRIQSQRQRENRQETERLKSLVSAYRSLAGSFSPAREEHREQLEETLADIVLFGSIREVELAARCALALTRGEPVSYHPLIEALRADVRAQLGLQPIPTTVELPPSGPGRRAAREGESGGRSAGGSGGGGLGGAAGAGGLGAGMIAGDAAHHPDL